MFEYLSDTLFILATLIGSIVALSYVWIRRKK
ncbi:EYxxD motif small membrane protein [Lottiidibacillus patelloidae]